MAKSISVEDSIRLQRAKLAKLRSEIKDTDLRKNALHSTAGAHSNETDKLQKRWAGLKVKERSLSSELEKSEEFLKAKRNRNTRPKKHKSFSEHLFSKNGLSDLKT